LNAVLKAKNLALVGNQVENIGGTNGDTGITPGAAIIVDGMDEDASLPHSMLSVSSLFSLRENRRDDRHDNQGQSAEY
jgi:hypothetical protein